MKKLVIIFMVIVLDAYDIKELLKMINILQNQDFYYKQIQTLYNPFDKQTLTRQAKLTLKKIKTQNQEVKKYILEVIFQNKVKINNKWYKDGDKIDKYTIIINDNKVFLKGKSKIINLIKPTLLKVK